MSIIEIKNNNYTVGINTFGSELTYVKNNSGKDFIWEGNKDVWALHAPIMFPICGGLKEDVYEFKGKKYTLGKHGFARNLEFSGEKINETKAIFTLLPSDETKKSYPFDFCLKVIFELIDAKLKTTYEVTNNGNTVMPFSVGAHEGYACPGGIEEYEIQFDKPVTLDSYILNGNLLENNKITVLENGTVFPLKYDYFKVDALVFKNVDFASATLAAKDGSRKVRVEFDGANYFLLWTKPNADYICLEPWHGVQDIVGSSYDIEKKEGIINLNPGKSYSAVHTIECTE